MGGSSSSSTAHTTTSSTDTRNEQASTGDVATGATVLQGQTITNNQSFGPDVQKAFGELIAIGTHSLDIMGKEFEAVIDLSNKALDGSINTGNTAIAAVAARSQQSETPGLSTTQTLAPILGLAFVAVLFLAWKGK